VADLTLGSDAVGLEVGPLTHAIDARWLMAYAAGLGETAPGYYDTRAAGGPAAHPVFPVCYEWPLALRIHARIASETVQQRSVHAAHDLTIHRPPRAGDTLVTRARVVSLAQRPPGAFLVVRYETVDADGRPVTTTDYGSIYRGVAVKGPDRAERPWTADGRPAAEPAPVATVAVPATLAHVYTECARIWNPIHTDIGVAERAGLPDIILHGTATLALAVSRVLAALGAGPEQVRRVTGRFTGMVRMPSALTVRALPGRGDAGPTWFDALGADGRPVLAWGTLTLHAR
jgi:acyl dehydratase